MMCINVNISHGWALVCQVADSLLWTNSQIHWYNPTRLKERDRETEERFYHVRLLRRSVEGSRGVYLNTEVIMWLWRTPRAHLKHSLSNLYTAARISKNFRMLCSSFRLANCLKVCWICFLSVLAWWRENRVTHHNNTTQIQYNQVRLDFLSSSQPIKGKTHAGMQALWVNAFPAETHRWYQSRWSLQRDTPPVLTGNACGIWPHICGGIMGWVWQIS